MTDVFCIERYKFKRTTIPALRAGWRQIAAATVGGTIQYTEQCSGVDPTPLQPRRGAGTVGCYGYERPTSGLTANGGRLPPLQWGYHNAGHTIHPHRLYIQRGGRQVADGIMV